MSSTLDSRQLHVFDLVAHSLSLRVAAGELGITVSGVSHCLKALERDLGCRLFDRTSGRLVLSPEGAAFAVEARQILEHMRDARGRVRSANAWQPASLRLGAEATACRHILPSVIREFRESFPACHLSIQAARVHDLAEALGELSLDLALAIEPEPNARLRFAPVGEDDLLFCVHPLHPWALHRQVDRSDLARRKLKLILPEQSSPTFQLVQEYFRREGIPVDPGLEVSDDDTALELVRLDLGIALLPRWLVASDLEQRRLVGLPVGRRRLTRRWGFLHAATRSLSFPDQMLATLCRTVLLTLNRTSATAPERPPDVVQPAPIPVPAA